MQGLNMSMYHLKRALQHFNCLMRVIHFDLPDIKSLMYDIKNALHEVERLLQWVECLLQNFESHIPLFGG